MLSPLLKIDWHSLLVGDEEMSFLLETAFRSLAMFLIILFGLRLLGKRGIKQLSVFELGVIIGLGSAAGDPMFYRDVGLLVGLVVFIAVITLYKLVTFFFNKSERFEQFIEGKPTYVIRDGCILIDNFNREDIARDELFMQLRLNHVVHLGQVEYAIVETNGEVSVFFYSNEAVRAGLPVLPHLHDNKLIEIPEAGVYSCSYCGKTRQIETTGKTLCDTCQKHEWVASLSGKRIS